MGPMTTRRRLIQTAGALGAAALGGCLHDDEDGPPEDVDVDFEDEDEDGEEVPGDVNWPVYSGDAASTGASDHPGPDEVEPESWDVGHAINSTPVVVDGVVYVATTDGSLHALEDGDRVWEFETEARIEASPAVSDDGVVAIANDDGEVYGVDVEDGRESWDFEIDDWIRSPLAYADGDFYVGGRDGYLHRLDAEWGDRVWSYETDNEIRGKPAVIDDSVYITTRGGNVHRVTVEDGERVRSTSQADDCRSSPAVGYGDNGHVVYFGTEDGTVHSVEFYGTVDVERREKRWEYRTNGAVRTSPALWDDRVFVGSDDGNLYCLDRWSGDEVWRFETEEEIRSSPAVDEERVYFGGVDDTVYSVSVESGDEVWSVDTDGSVRGAVGISESVYAGSVDDHVYVLG